MFLPQARVRKTIKLDPEVKNVKKEALVTLSKATELFLGYIAQRASAKVVARKGISLVET